MKKVISINIGGMVFSIEDVAYKQLESYLSEVRNHFKSDPACDEIIEDIESSIAEKFTQKKKNLDRAVTGNDVTEIIEQLGTVQDFVEDQAGEESSEPKNPTQTNQTKRLYRDTDEGIIAGVAAGIAQYFGIDPVIPRVIFLVLAFWGGFGIIAYLILWAIVPKAKTTSQKLEMKGVVADLESIKTYMEDQIKKIPSKNGFHKIITFPITLLGLLFTALKQIMPFIRVAFGSFLVLIASVLIFVFSTVFFGALVGDFSIDADPVTTQAIESFLLESDQLFPFLLGLYTSIMIPLLLMFLLGSGVIFKKKFIGIWVFTLLFFVWIGALSYTTATGFVQFIEVDETIKTLELQVEESPNAEFYLKINSRD